MCERLILAIHVEKTMENFIVESAGESIEEGNRIDEVSIRVG
jgi:hypothetical protein